MKVSDNYLELVDKFIFSGVPVKDMHMTDEQKMRTMIVYEAYQVWLNNKQIKAMDLCRNIAARIYSDMLNKSMHDPSIAQLCERMKIRPGKCRDYSKLSNDVQTFDHIVGLLNRTAVHIERAKVEDASDWLISDGMSSHNANSVKSGADLKMKLNKDFDEKQQGFENIANTDVNITGDVSVVKQDVENYTDEEKRKFSKQFNLPEKEVEELILNDRGVYETAPEPEEIEKDIYERNEE